MLKDQIIAFLSPETFVSGAWIAAQLGVTRAAVAKAITSLRREGYQIEAAPNRGYCLKKQPDRLSERAILENLPTDSWQGSLRVLETVDSTNTELKRLAAQGVPAGFVVAAEQQTAGRGRMGRTFLSAPGSGVYLSMLLRPDCAPQALMSLTAQAAAAAHQAIERCCGVCAQIKWVNDLQLAEKKICGILTELSIEAESGRVSYAVVGVGINCNQDASAFPPELREIAGSIYSQTGVRVDRNRLAAELIRALSELPELDWKARYETHCVTLGKDIDLIDGDRRVPAKAIGLGPQAELLVMYTDGSRGVVNSGEVSVRVKNLP